VHLLAENTQEKIVGRYKRESKAFYHAMDSIMLKQPLKRRANEKE